MKQARTFSSFTAVGSALRSRIHVRLGLLQKVWLLSGNRTNGTNGTNGAVGGRAGLGSRDLTVAAYVFFLPRVLQQNSITVTGRRRGSWADGRPGRLLRLSRCESEPEPEPACAGQRMETEVDRPWIARREVFLDHLQAQGGRASERASEAALVCCWLEAFGVGEAGVRPRGR